MGESLQVTNDRIMKRPGVMIVRPSLHSQTNENAATFKRWTIMHFRDLLNLSPAQPHDEGISQTLRFTNTAGELFYTIHADDISTWNMDAYHAISRRLDLENTRKVEPGETAVLSHANDPDLPNEPMVWHLVNAEFGIFDEQPTSEYMWEGVGSYQSLPCSLLSTKGLLPAAPPCLLVTLTYNDPASGEADLPKRLLDLQNEAILYLSADCTTSAGFRVHTSLYRHDPLSQPDQHPVIAEGADGNGAWVVCVLVEGEVSAARQTALKTGLENWVEERKERAKEKMMGWRIGVEIWMGEVFMG